VVIHDFNLMCAILSPNKADAPLVIDADAVLPFAVALQRLKLVARGNPQASKRIICPSPTSFDWPLPAANVQLPI
jgi:hypothetical protein